MPIIMLYCAVLVVRAVADSLLEDDEMASVCISIIAGELMGRTVLVNMTTSGSSATSKTQLNGI